jgi:hypothetical protein
MKMHWKRLAGALDHLGEAGAGKRRAALRDEDGSGRPANLASAAAEPGSSRP